MNILPIYLIEDEHGSEYQEKIKTLVGLTTKIEGKDYPTRVILLETWEKAKEVLLKNENLSRGGIIVTDGALDPRMHNNPETFSPKLLLGLKESVSHFFYSMVIFTAHEDGEMWRLTEKYREKLKPELYYRTIHKMAYGEFSFENQFKEYLEYFKQNYCEVNGNWRNKVLLPWKESFSFEIIYCDRLGKRTSLDIKQVMAIHCKPPRVGGGYRLYEISNPFNPIEAEYINLNDNDLREELKKYDPVNKEYMFALFSEIEHNPPTLVCIHQEFIVNMVYYEKVVTPGKFSRKNLNYLPTKLYEEDHQTEWIEADNKEREKRELPPKKEDVGFIERDYARMVELKNQEDILYIQIGGGRAALGEKLGIDKLKCYGIDSNTNFFDIKIKYLNHCREKWQNTLKKIREDYWNS